METNWLPDRDDLPVACTLGSDEGAERVRRWKELVERAAPTSRRVGNELELRFPLRQGVQEELEALAEAEARCCAFVTWTVLVDGGQPVLRITAPEDRPEDIESIASVFAGPYGVPAEDQSPAHRRGSDL